MEPPGKYLRAERLSRNLLLADVAKSTRIQRDILHAIEEGRDDLLPPPFYLKAFLTAYAKYLGLDPNELIQQSQHCLNHPSYAPSPMKLKRSVQSSRKAGTRRLLLPWSFAMGLFLFLIITYYISKVSVEQDFQFFSEMPAHTARLPSMRFNSPIPTKSDTQFSMESIPLLSFEIIEAVLGKEVEKEDGFLKLTETCTKFLCNNQKVFFLTTIKGKKEGKLTHVWSWKGREFYRTEIEITPPTRSVYSYFTLRPNHTGDWTVEVRDGNSVLKRLNFEAASPDTYS